METCVVNCLFIILKCKYALYTICCVLFQKIAFYPVWNFRSNSYFSSSVSWRSLFNGSNITFQIVFNIADSVSDSGKYLNFTLVRRRSKTSLVTGEILRKIQVWNSTVAWILTRFDGVSVELFSRVTSVLRKTDWDAFFSSYTKLLLWV